MTWKIKEDEILIYPTDTIYGVGCDATNQDNVQRIRAMKKRPEKPFSVIAPSKQWIHQNCYISRQATHFLKKLPGPYTLILPLQNTESIAPNVTTNKKIGVRIPNHWIKSTVKEFGKPFITTSVNISGQPYYKHPKNIPNKLRTYADTVIDQGYLDNGSSIVYDCTTVSPRRIR